MLTIYMKIEYLKYSLPDDQNRPQIPLKHTSRAFQLENIEVTKYITPISNLIEQKKKEKNKTINLVSKYLLKFPNRLKY